MFEPIEIHYNKLKEAAEKIQSGESTQEQYVKILDQISTTISEALYDMKSIEIPDNVHPLEKEVSRECLKLEIPAVECFLKGVNEMRFFLEDSNQQHISKGLDLACEGNETLNNVLKMARTALEKIEKEK